MPVRYDLELAKAGGIVARDLCAISPGESVLLTVDSAMDFRPVEEVAKAAEAAGGRVIVAWHSTPRGYGKVADAQLPEPLKRAIPAADVWVEFNDQWLLYSTPWIEAMSNGKTRYLFLGGLDSVRVVRCIARLDMSLQERFQSKVVELTERASNMRVRTPAGTDVAFENVPGRPVTNELRADTPGPHFLVGQIGWAPREESIEGTIVFDGSFSGGGDADLGVLVEPIALRIAAGRIVEISGGAQAARLRAWLERLADSNMYNLAHICYGFNPGSILTGLCTEDERVWGATEWGNGYQGPMFDGNLPEAVSHGDGICLQSSVWLDDVPLLEEGRVVHPELAEMAREIGK